MSDSNPPIPDSTVDAIRLRTKERLYVICQSVGWGAFLVMQIFFTRVIRESQGNPQTFTADLHIAMVILSGLLVSHYARHYIEKWRLKEMGWVRLLPRALVLAAIMSIVWSVVGYGWIYGVLRDSWSNGVNPFILVTISIINGTIAYSAWLSIYFIYHVFDRYNRSEIERLRLTAVVKDAELRALKSQVNPHFMFNSLNSVRALIDEDPDRARQAVTQLANMLRYSLKAGATETVSFEDELEVVNDYLALEQVRHEERLRLKIDVTSESLSHSVPPMLLQTLVENAIKYGVSTRPEGGEITITARLDNKTLRVEVKNPGRLDDATTHGRSARSTGVGLRNAGDRLQLLFGDQAKLQVIQTGKDEVTAIVFVPETAMKRSLRSTRPNRGEASVGSLQEASS